MLAIKIKKSDVTLSNVQDKQTCISAVCELMGDNTEASLTTRQLTVAIEGQDHHFIIYERGGKLVVSKRKIGALAGARSKELVTAKKSYSLPHLVEIG